MTRRLARLPIGVRPLNIPSNLATFRAAPAVASIRHFHDRAFEFDSAEFEVSPDGNTLTKRALVMVEGVHVDSAKRKHEFSADRVQRIADNTNAFLESGGRVPWQRDHKKGQPDNLGDLEGLLETRIITAKDLPDPRLKNLVGKLGAFTTELVAKGRDVVQQILAGRIKTLSPGIDVVSDVIREISATPTPAIVGLSTFARTPAVRRKADFALTWDEMEAETADMDGLKEEFEQLGETFWSLITNISQSSEDELQGADPVELQFNAIDEYNARIADLLQLNTPPEDPMAQDPNAQGLPDQGYAAQRGGRFSEFSIEAIEAEFRKPRRDRGRKRGKRTSLVQKLVGTTTAGRVARGAAAAGAIGGAVALARRGRGKGAPDPTKYVNAPGESLSALGGRGAQKQLKGGRKDTSYRTGNLGKERTTPPYYAMQNANRKKKSRAMGSLTWENNRQREQSRGMRLRPERGVRALPSKRGTIGPDLKPRKKKK
jgi:hypothetical protein